MSKLFTRKALAFLIFGLVIVVVGGRSLMGVPAVQDRLLDRGAAVMAERAAAPFERPNGLKVYVCGSSSPLGNTGAQACIAVVTPEHFYLIDSGAGSTDNLGRLGLPMADLDGLLLTHFHSDHIAEIYEVNLASWVGGRPAPLTIIGPEGVEDVTEGVNAGYRLDRIYRSEHHGEDMLPPELGVLQHQTIAPGVILKDGDLTVTAYVSEHPPIHPAVGYRFDYKGRSVVISGDSNVTEETRKISEGADLLLHDALSLPITTTFAEALTSAGQTRTAKIVTDVMDYHASAESLIELGERADIGMVAFYHLVPAPVIPAMGDIFMRGTPENFVLTVDLMAFELPIGSDDIVVTGP